MPAKQPNKRGRPKVEIDWDKVGKLFEAGATVVGTAATIGCDPDTLSKRCREDLNSDLSAFRQQKVAKGDELLRTKQFQVAMTGDKTMLVWLGKQRLGQADKQEIGNKDGEAFKQEVEVIFTNDGNG
jgi:hypothetical protein